MREQAPHPHGRPAAAGERLPPTARAADSAAERLKRILALEGRRAFADQAVIGGLSGLVARWLADSATPPETRAALAALRDYSRSPVADRRELVNQARALLDRASTPAPPPLAPSPPAARQPAEPVPAARDEPPPRPRPPARARPSRADSSPSADPLAQPLSAVKGIGSARAQRLRKLGLETIADLLFFTPRRHLDFRTFRRIADLVPGEPQTILASVWNVQVSPVRRRLLRITATLNDSSGSCRVVWFRAQDYISGSLPERQQVIVSGVPEVDRGVLSFRDPEWEVFGDGDPVHTGRLVPVYALTEGIYDRWLRQVMKQVVEGYAPLLPDPLPPAIRERHYRRGKGDGAAAVGPPLLDLATAIAQAHFPESLDALERAKERLAFDELLLIQLGVQQRRRAWEQAGNAPALADRGIADRFLGSLPFAPTAAQRRALAAIIADLGRTAPMHRLLQGDVGTGKTVVAVGAMLVALANGYQSVLMAPTEILAEQHYATISRLVEPAGAWLWPGERRQVTVGLLTGSLTRSAKDELTTAIADGGVDLVIGTHALIEEGVTFRRIGIVVVDEQHRFGVMQRAALRGKGEAPHTLVMTATPIPRTLALTLYGDLDVATLDELPAGRLPVVTRCLRPNQRARAYQFIREQVQAGRQAFIICPLVEESDKLEVKAATAEYERLQREVFPDLRLGLLHGRMRSAEKEAVMRAFQQGALDVLVSTAVVEVGVDVPNATVMLIEGAERFGLAQLHQFRGRVGRSVHQSYCLLASDSSGREAQERLATVERTTDGFVLAEADLLLRGPGEFFGTRQSGLPELRYANLTDTALVEDAQAAARVLTAADPQLTRPEHTLLARRLAHFWHTAEGVG